MCSSASTTAAGGRSLAWGAVLAVMNACFYLAIERLPLGTVAAIEFLPVIALAALGTRTPRNAVALALAVGGVWLLTDVRLEGEPLGVAFALVNALLFALYIVLGHRVAQGEQISGIDGSGRVDVRRARRRDADRRPGRRSRRSPIRSRSWRASASGSSSSVIPYVCDQLAMARLARATYALLVSLLPATATVIGILVLGQVPTVVEVVGVALVVLGVAVYRERSRQPPELAGQPQLVEDRL